MKDVSSTTLSDWRSGPDQPSIRDEGGGPPFSAPCDVKLSMKIKPLSLRVMFASAPCATLPGPFRSRARLTISSVLAFMQVLTSMRKKFVYTNLALPVWLLLPLFHTFSPLDPLIPFAFCAILAFFVVFRLQLLLKRSINILVVQAKLSHVFLI
eukprot:939349-Pleurochrysis_carterae.AAC.1